MEYRSKVSLIITVDEVAKTLCGSIQDQSKPGIPSTIHMADLTDLDEVNLMMDRFIDLIAFMTDPDDDGGEPAPSSSARSGEFMQGRERSVNGIFNTMNGNLYPRACVDCMFYKINFGVCAHPDIKKLDRVFGVLPIMARQARASGEKCGESGKMFQGKSS